jgi:hypothetical protein
MHQTVQKMWPLRATVALAALIWVPDSICNMLR